MPNPRLKSALDNQKQVELYRHITMQTFSLKDHLVLNSSHNMEEKKYPGTFEEWQPDNYVENNHNLKDSHNLVLVNCPAEQ